MTPSGSRTDELIRVCRRHILGPAIDVVVPEPYIPHVPPNWNGALVLAEAQNLSNTYRSYRETLLRWSSENRITRLGRRAGLDIHPWDDGWLKLAVHVTLELDPPETAVSNAVLWSQVKTDGGNRPPSLELQQQSAAVWTDLLLILQPKHIISAGNKACFVISQASTASPPPWRHTALVFPAGPNLSRWLKDYDVSKLMAAYPEVARAQRERGGWFAGNTGHKTLFACHAVNESERTARAARIGPHPGSPTIRLERLRGHEKV